MLFDRKHQLCRKLDSLAMYNDKGIDWRRDSPDQTQAHRTAAISEIRELVHKLGPDELPSGFLEALESGAVETDGSGTFVEQVKAHFRQLR